MKPLLPGCALLLLLLVACHDTRRNNPLDPQLTPAVELSVAVDDRDNRRIQRFAP